MGKEVLYFIATFYLALLAIAYFFSDRLIFIQPPSSYTDDKKLIKLNTADGAVITAIYLQNPAATYTLLVSHGNAEDIGTLLPFLQDWRDHGFSVFAYDYHGYGTSTGKPTEQHAYNDINAAYAYLIGTLRVPADRLIAYGRSVGAGPTFDLAVHEPVAAVIVESPFVTAFRVMTRIPLLPFDKFNNLQKIQTLRRPLLFIHGTHDRVVPAWHSRRLYAAAHAPKQIFWVAGADHNDVLWVAGDRYWQVIAKFIASLPQSSP